MLRRTAALAALTLAASLAAVISAPAQAADATLSVPESPTGDVTVTATVDLVAAPYLQVQAILGSAPTAPYDGIDPAPVANPGVPVEITVPTWGLHNRTVTFILLGCTTADPATCASALAQQTRIVTQAAPATATVELPDAKPIFHPEDDVFITAHNSDGGVVKADYYPWAEGSRWYQTLTPGVRTKFLAFPESEAGDGEIGVSRCSALTNRSVYCEPAALTPVSFIGRPMAWILRSDQGDGPLTVNPTWSGSTRTYEAVTYAERLPYDLSWELLDGDGERVAGPVQVVDGETDRESEFDVSPGKETNGVLPDGNYVLRLTATVTRGDIVKTGSLDRHITIVNDPPADNPKLLFAQRILRPGTRHEFGSSARFSVQGYPGTAGGTLRIRNRAGRVVFTDDLWNPCAGLTTCTNPIWRPNISMFSFNSRDAGTYTAELTLPDSWGRPMTKQLGKVYVQDVDPVRRTVQLTATSARKAGTRFAGACSAVRSPGPHRWPGSVGLLSLSRCDNAAGTRDQARQNFVVKVPRVTAGYERFGGYEVGVYGAAKAGWRGEAHSRLSAIGTSWGARVHFWNGVGWHTADETIYNGSRDPRGQTVEVRARVRDGATLDLRSLRVRFVYWVWRTVP
ncbi:hypothetical protein [Nocardioides speluncae]|uniref:hypothetical protein n=1 Tax=Nocardioides speluncae TaxID=2670337 RepID=UPI000D696D52|nr:hypothetical protein [Nocardioides speluncae]